MANVSVSLHVNAAEVEARLRALAVELERPAERRRKRALLAALALILAALALTGCSRVMRGAATGVGWVVIGGPLVVIDFAQKRSGCGLKCPKGESCQASGGGGPMSGGGYECRPKPSPEPSASPEAQ